ncbi:MAG: hypothetical protein Q9175_005967 [Cornicularia normoerica]
MANPGVFWVLLVFTIPETRHTIILQKKTKCVRRTMRKEDLKAANADERKWLHQLLAITLTRPFHLLFIEPIAFFAAISSGSLCGLVYLLNKAFPLVFSPRKGLEFNGGEQGLTFLVLYIRPIITFLFYHFEESYSLRRVTENDGKSIPEAQMWINKTGAEAQMWIARLSTIFVAISLS